MLSTSTMLFKHLPTKWDWLTFEITEFSSDSDIFIFHLNKNGLIYIMKQQNKVKVVSSWIL